MRPLKVHCWFPNLENNYKAERALLATLHCQLCRFVIRCDSVRHYFEVAAAKFIKDRHTMDIDDSGFLGGGKLRKNKQHNLLFNLSKTIIIALCTYVIMLTLQVFLKY